MHICASLLLCAATVYVLSLLLVHAYVLPWHAYAAQETGPGHLLTGFSVCLSGPYSSTLYGIGELLSICVLAKYLDNKDAANGD